MKLQIHNIKNRHVFLFHFQSDFKFLNKIHIGETVVLQIPGKDHK